MAKRILVVEDDDAVADLVTMILEDAGHVVDRATNANAGLQHIQAVRPDLVLLDVTLPGLSGLSLLRACKSDLALASLPIVVMSGAAIAVSEHGPAADGEIRKPFDIDELCSIVDRLIGSDAALLEGAPT
jgi:DNA-binding response OmpR family regulator